MLANEKEINVLRIMRSFNNDGTIRLNITIPRNYSLESIKDIFTKEGCSSIITSVSGKTEMYEGYSLERISESLDDSRSELFVELTKSI